MDYPQTFSTMPRKARKQHKCCECYTPIKIGEIYQFSSGIWDGEPDSFKQCLNCNNIMSHVAVYSHEDDWGCDGPSFGALIEWFQGYECIGYTGHVMLNDMSEKINIPVEKLNKLLKIEVLIMDIGSKSGGPAGKLSNFTPRPFVFRGVECNSMEGLLQGFKFKDPEMQKHACTLVGFKAKRFGSKKNWQTSQTLWWQGEPIKRDSDDYQELLDDAYQTLYNTNQKAKKTLLSTGDANLTHSIGRTKMNETVLTRKEFCSRLMCIRAQLKANKFVEM